MNVTETGYSLVIDLNTSSSALFLLVKSSPILRHSVSPLVHTFYYDRYLLYCFSDAVLEESLHTCPLKTGTWPFSRIC
jgi:hypothetical protein